VSGPTGAQFEIASGAARAIITEIGATLRGFEVDGQCCVESFDAGAEPPMGSGAVLIPWPNRTRGGRWEFEGSTQQLPITEPARGNAIHGLVRRVRWQVITHTGSLISLGVGIKAQPGWPVPLWVTISYAVDGDGLTVTHGVHNVGDRPVPFGVGAHPYLRVGMVETDDCALRLAATTHLPLSPETMTPEGVAVPVAGTDLDFRSRRPVRGTRLDDVFGGCEPDADGLIRHCLYGGGKAVEMWTDLAFSWVQVYTADRFPGRGRAIAVEPMTCPPDALNSGTDLITLTPGAAWSGRWGLTSR